MSPWRHTFTFTFYSFYHYEFLELSVTSLNNFCWRMHIAVTINNVVYLSIIKVWCTNMVWTSSADELKSFSVYTGVTSWHTVKSASWHAGTVTVADGIRNYAMWQWIQDQNWDFKLQSCIFASLPNEIKVKCFF